MMDCVFCQIVTRNAAADIVFEDDETLCFLDKYPQTYGQLQLIPKTHYEWIYDIDDIGRFFLTAKRIIRVIIPLLKADHVTLATFGHQIKHAHLWIVPQYQRSTQVKEFRLGVINKQSVELAHRLKAVLQKEVA